MSFNNTEEKWNWCYKNQQNILQSLFEILLLQTIWTTSALYAHASVWNLFLQYITNIVDYSIRNSMTWQKELRVIFDCHC